jgi:DNA invertase Pin-like site-specific DNA recombinase
VRLYIVKDGLETSGTVGRLIITVLAGVAQLERDLIPEGWARRHKTAGR